MARHGTFKPAYFDQFFILTSWFELNHLRLVEDVVSSFRWHISHHKNTFVSDFHGQKHDTHSYTCKQTTQTHIIHFAYAFRAVSELSSIRCVPMPIRSFFDKNIFAFSRPLNDIHMILAQHRSNHRNHCVIDREHEWEKKLSKFMPYYCYHAIRYYTMSAPYCRYDHIRNFLTLEFSFSIIAILPFGISTAFHSKRNTDADAGAFVCLCDWMCSSVVVYKLDAYVRIYIKKFQAS